jgi:uncharacterized SAM-binding protein YcdF (DUF218 family)
MRRFIVIPEGVKAGPDGRGIAEPSFVYRQVLDFTLQFARPGDEVYLAPANAFGGPMREEETARLYLEKQRAPFRILHPGHNLPANQQRPRYVDTLDNARLLRDALGGTTGSFELISAQRHARRAELCFRHTGFQLAAVHRVPYLFEDEAVPRRVGYYRSRWLYPLYESTALLRDRLSLALRWR